MAVDWAELRLRCLRLVAALLKQSDDSISWALHLEEPIVPALMVAAASPVTPIRHVALDCLSVLSSSMGAGLDSHTYLPLLEGVKDRREEIMLDAEYVCICNERVCYSVLSLTLWASPVLLTLGKIMCLV